MNTRYRALDVSYALQLSECKLLFVVPRSGPVEYVEMLKTVLPGFDRVKFDGATEFPHLQDIVVVCDESNDQPVSWQQFISQADKTLPEGLAKASALVTPEDIALIIFTSGTTGTPKAVMHNHRILRNILERHGHWPIRTGDAVLCFLPMFHIYGMSDNMLAGLLIGSRQIVMDVWDVEDALRLIESEQVAGLHGFETRYADILRAQGLLRRNLSSVRFGSLPAGMENSNAVAAEVQTSLCRTVSGWGMSAA